MAEKSGLEIIKKHLEKGGHTSIDQSAWQTLKDRGWHPQQITALIPHTGMQVDNWTANKVTNFPNATRNVGASGLYNIGTAMGWVGKGHTQDVIKAAGTTFANTPRGKHTNRSGWQAGFTEDAASWLTNQWNPALGDIKLREETPEEDPQWATNLSQTLTDLTRQINEPAVDPSKMGGYDTASYVGDGGTASLKIEPKKRGSRDKGTRRFRRSSWSMPTTNTASGKASSAVNV